MIWKPPTGHPVAICPVFHAPGLHETLAHPPRPPPASAVMDQERKIRREIANSNERRRMQSINSGFQSLRTLLPHHEGEKLSKVSDRRLQGRLSGPCHGCQDDIAPSLFLSGESQFAATLLVCFCACALRRASGCAERNI